MKTVGFHKLLLWRIFHLVPGLNYKTDELEPPNQASAAFGESLSMCGWSGVVLIKQKVSPIG